MLPISTAIVRGILIIFTLLLSSCITFGQNAECFVPLEISIPFNKRKNLIEKVNKETKAEMNKSYFLRADEYSYWYKVTPEVDAEIDIKVSATNLDDMHDVLIFKYNDTSFCKDVVYGDYPEEKMEDKQLFHQNSSIGINVDSYQFEAGSDYYIAVIAFNVFDCGHVLRLQHNKHVLKINAIHRGCFEFVDEQNTVAESMEDNEPEFIELTGHLFSNKENFTIPGKMTFIEDSTGIEYEATVSSTKGYRIQLRRGAEYRVKGSALYHRDRDSSLIFNSSAAFDMELMKLKKGDGMVFGNIYFHGNVHKMKEESLEGLEELLHFMEDNPEFKIEIQGHTAGDTPVKTPDPRYRGRGKDWIFKGSAKKLSKMRAEEVKQHLVKNGISPSRMKVVGYGASRKIYENPTTDREHRMNMRVEILILSD